MTGAGTPASSFNRAIHRVGMMRAQDDNDIGSFTAMRADLLKAVGDAQTKSTDTQRFQYRSARDAIITKE